jgi:hypothetical protein
MSYHLNPAIGPVKRSKLSLMGLRFADGEAEGAPATPAPSAEPIAPAAEAAPAAQNVGELPDWAQKLITDVRGEAAKYRTEAKTAAEQAQAELTDRFAKVFGLKEDAVTDPEALAKAVSEAQQKAAQSARELAIFKAAGPLGANPAALLDSLAFKSSVDGLDPSDGAGITSAIQAALTANPNLKAVQAAAASGTELGGSQEAGLITDEQLARMSPEQIDTALREGKLQHLLA